MDSSKIVTLTWTAPSNISDLTDHKHDEAGIYIWGFTIERTFIPYYVGIANNIICRIYEHISAIIGGRYTIFHQDALANFKDFKKKDFQSVKSKGIIYTPNWPSSLNSFLENRKELRPHIDFMVDTFTFSYAVVEKDVATKQKLKAIENCCINQIGIANLINTRVGHSDNLIISHQGDNCICHFFN